jgi:cytochrome oxidase Cu insertion factor (SCO1/SenC/PrrC family)
MFCRAPGMGAPVPGMSSGLDVNNPAVVAAFRSALLHQGIAALLIFAVLSVAWVAIRDWAPGQAAGPGAAPAQAAVAEPGWRRMLRVGFGLLWLLDGILQAQPGMAVGLPSQVIEPTATSSPGWVQHLVNWAGTTWSYHPVQAGAAAVWIQAGIGLWLLFAARGPLSRLAGISSIGWGLIVWVFGESFGGVLAPGLSFLTGAPGAAAFYCAAGVLIALPARSWGSPQLGRLFGGGLGVLAAGMAVLQAWPGRGFWPGSIQGQPGSLTSMVQSMAATPQPRPLAAMASGAAAFVRDHGFAVNLAAVIVLALAGAALAGAAVLGGGPPGRGGRLARAGTGALVLLCLATWIGVQDFGFFGGLGTDPNSMIPVVLLAVAAYLALIKVPARAAVPAAEAAAPAAEAAAPAAEAAATEAAGRGAARAAAGPAPQAAATEATGPRAPAEAAGPGAAGQAGGRWPRIHPGALPASLAATSARTMLSASAIGVIILGAVPMAAAQASSSASPILAESIDGSSAPLASPAPPIALTDEHGRPVSLAGLHGKAVLLTFLDPVCVTQCPIEAQEFKQADALLGAKASRVELVAVNLNPLYASPAYTSAFDRAEGLGGLRNWRFLTGRPAQLQPVWRAYGQTSQTLPGGSMLGHGDSAFVIDPTGWMREELNFDPGPGTAATESSFAAELAAAARQALGAR